MNDLRPTPATILVEADFPHAPALVWRALTEGPLMARWMMPPQGFAPVVGQAFTFQTKPAGLWDGTIRCRVLEVRPGERLSYSWDGGDDGNQGYGSLLSTSVTMTLTPTATGTRLRVEHAGFDLPRNEVAHTNMGNGWRSLMSRLDSVTADCGEEGKDG